MSETGDLHTSERIRRSQRMHAHLHRFKNRMRKHWWIPVVTVLIGLGIQGIRIWRTPPTYISVGQMIVNFKISTPNASVATFSPEWNNFLGTEAAVMQNERVLSRAAQLVRDLKPNLPASLTLIKVSPLPKTTLFNLVAVGPDPAYTQAYLDAVMDAYLQVRQEMKEETADSYITGMRKELIRLQKELARGDQLQYDFQSSNNIVVLQEQGGKASSYLVDLDNQSAKLKTEYDLVKSLNLDQNLELQREQGKELPSIDSSQLKEAASDLFGATTDYQKLKQQILLKKAEQTQLSEFLRPKHPKMIALTKTIAEQENLLQILRNQSAEQLTNNLNSLELRIKNLDNQIAEWKVKSLEISRQVAQYQKIKTDNERNKQSYDRILATVQSLDVSKGADAATVTTFKRASIAAPNIPDLFHYFLFGVLGGLATSGVILLLIDRLDDRLNSFVELQDAFEEPILGQIPLERPPVKNTPVRLLQPNDQRHAFVEAYRNLRSSLLYMFTEGKRAKTLLVTSAVPGDGKSMTTANLAIILAQSGSKVLLVDADLRKGLLHRHFSASGNPGLTEVLSEGLAWASAVVPTFNPMLSLLPRGAICNNPGELFLNPATHEILKDMAQHYDYVVIDSAPVMAADDVTSLSPHIEGVIFIVRANSTSARVAHAALDLLYQREVNILGLVLNSVQAETSEYYFYKYKDYHATNANP